MSDKTEDDVMETINKFYADEGIDIGENTVFNTDNGKENAKNVNHDPLVELAKNYGWNQEGEKTAEEFIKYALDKHPERGKEIKDLRRTVDELKAYMAKQEERAYQKAMKELQRELPQAQNRGDMDRVREIEEEIANMTPDPVTPPAMVEFQEKHAKWINGTDFDAMEIRNFALLRDKELAKLKLSPEEHLKTLEQHLHRKFPEYFKEAEIVENVVEQNTNVVGTAKKKFSFNDLTKEQKKMARDFEKFKVMDVDTYIQELVKSGDLV